MEKIGLLAGVGKLPVECARAAKLVGYEVYAVALLEETDPELDEAAFECAHISIAQMGEILAYLKSKQVEKITMIGKVTKEYRTERHIGEEVTGDIADFIKCQ